MASGLVAALLLKRGAEDVAERGAGVGRAILGNRLLLLGDFQRLDRDRQLARLLVEGNHPRVELLTDGEALGALLVAITRQIGPLDEGLDALLDEPHLDAAILDADDF